MADLDVLVRRQYVERQLLTRRAVLATRKAWSLIDAGGIRGSWQALVGPAVLAIVAGAQTQAAARADATVESLLKAQNVAGDEAGRIRPDAFSGTASDGRDLAALLELSNVFALQRIGQGATPADSLGMAGRWLTGAVGTQVLNAGRAAVSVAITSRPHVGGYIRTLNPPTCSRCAILAGAFYRWRADFELHTHCDCGQVPVGRESDAQDLVTDPMAAFRAGQITDLSQADTLALNEGADIGQVVNAHRGMYQVGGRSFTREGTTRRGFAGRRAPNTARLTPAQIFRDATSRDDAIRLLFRFGYIS